MQRFDHEAFKTAFARLNPNQRSAVQQTDGPLLVIAGPGTGKTQLLSARVAYILEATDTLPQNILCLTFTESGANNMRQRLTSFIGQAAYDVTIGTYHAFGGELIGRFPQYFGDHKAQSPLDGLGQREIVQAIVDAMEFRNPLKSSQHHLHDLMSTISEVKRGLLTEDDLRGIAQDNLTFLAEANTQIKQIFADFRSMPRKLELALPYFQNLYGYLIPRDQAAYTLGKNIRPLAGIVQYELAQAIAKAIDTSSGKASTTPLTAWKNHWLQKDADNNFIIAGQRDNERVAALADVMGQYAQALESRGLYDFDDMILRSIAALEQHRDLSYTLQEQYQYIMLDEFQDTNAAQLQLIKLLTDNPINEGRPNVMAVGDDDQAIYAFQGAEVSNMLEFAQMYQQTSVINLTDNYRSHPQILEVAQAVASQIATRLETSFDDMSKVLAAANLDLPKQSHIDRHEFLADVGQYDWIAHQIADLIASGVPAQEIAVLAPRHKQLEPLVAYLNELDIPVRYEKRENILEAPVVLQLLTMSTLILAIKDGQDALADSLWPEVLSYNFWQLPTAEIWKLSWAVRAESGLTWSQALLDAKLAPAEQPGFLEAGLLVLSLARQAGSETLEVIIDQMIGNQAVQTNDIDQPTVLSPLRNFYMGPESQAQAPDLFYQTLSHLTCLRQRLRDHQNGQDSPLKLADLISLVALYEAAGERMLNTSPYNQHAQAVQLMTVFKAKGLEFEHVFLPSCQDEVWGETSRGSANRLTLPANMSLIRPAGTSQDERLRIFFVAVTRAKLGLHITSYLETYSGRATKRLKYLNEVDAGGGSFKSLILPTESQDVRRIEQPVPQLNTMELQWRQRHLDSLHISSLRDLLSDHITNFKLSPTHVGNFTDLLYGGPQTFFFDNLLNFPHASGPEADYGTAVHETLQSVQQHVELHDLLPPRNISLQFFKDRLTAKHLRTDQFEQYLHRGTFCLDQYITQRGSIFKRGNKAEQNFRNENVMIGDAKMTGKIDLMEVDQKRRNIVVVDYKTGKSFDRWSSDAKLHKFRRQLCCYKLLIDNSRSFKGYSVTTGRIEFVEPDDNGKIHSLEMAFEPAELAETQALIQAVWNHVGQLNFPDVNDYEASLTGIRRFESALIAGLLPEAASLDD